MPSNTKSNKLLSLHLTYTQLVLAQTHLLHLQRLKHNQCTRSSLFCSKHSLFFSRVASGIQCIKGSSNEPGVPLYIRGTWLHGNVAEPHELSRLKCAGHHHKGNTGSNALQTEQSLVCRVTSRYNHRFSDRTSIPRTKASPEILQPQVLHHRHKSYYKPVLKHYYKTNLSKQLYKP